MSIRTVAMLGTACAVIGCSDVDSEDIRTSGIHASITVNADGSGNSEVSATLTAGSGGVAGSYVELTNSDKLTATALGETKTLSKNKDILNAVSYETLFTADYGGIEFTVSLTRENDEDAPNSVVTLPDASIVDSPAPGAVFSRTDPLNITWNNTQGSAKTIAISLYTQCTNLTGGSTAVSTSASVNDTGAAAPFSIADDMLAKMTNLDTSKQCHGTITLTRSATGVLDPHFGEGGSITAKQVRKTYILINPA